MCEVYLSVSKRERVKGGEVRGGEGERGRGGEGERGRGYDEGLLCDGQQKDHSDRGKHESHPK